VDVKEKYVREMLNSNMTNHIIIQLNKQEKMLLISFVLNVKGHAWQINSTAIPLWLGRSCSNEHKQYNPTKTVLLTYYYSIINIIHILISFYFDISSFQFNPSLHFSNCVLFVIFLVIISVLFCILVLINVALTIIIVLFHLAAKVNCHVSHLKKNIFINILCYYFNK